MTVSEIKILVSRGEEHRIPDTLEDQWKLRTLKNLKLNRITSSRKSKRIIGTYCHSGFSGVNETFSDCSTWK
jgi:hypothetical protein